MSKVHTFKDSYRKGKLGEEAVTKYFTDLGYQVTKVPIELEKRYGFDFVCVRDDKKFFVEVKTELEAETSGNIFYETQVNGKLGWCRKYTKLSNVLIFWYLPVSRKFLVLPSRKLSEIPYKRFSTRTIRNTKYKATGRLVPLTELEKYCKVIELDKEKTDVCN